MVDVGAARVEVVGDVRKFARQVQRDLDRALSNLRVRPVEVPVDTEQIRQSGEEAGEALGDGFRRGADGRLRDARGRFVQDASRIGQAGGRAAGSAFDESFSNAGLRSSTRAIGLAVARLPSLIGPSLITAGIGIASGIAVAAAAVLGSLLGSAILAAGGLGVIGLGAFLLREEPELVRAAKSLTDSVKSVFTDAAEPLIEPLRRALEVFRDLAIDIGPQVRDMFELIAPAIVPFSEGLAGLVENSLPGFVGLVGASVPLIANLGTSFEDLGTDFSVFFGSIADAAPELDVFLQDLIDGFGKLIIKLGEFIAWSGRTYVAMKDLAENGLDSQTFDTMVEGFKNLVERGINYVLTNLPRLIDQFLELKTQVVNAIVDMAIGVANALPTIIPAIVATLTGAITSLITGLVSAVPALVEAAGELVNGLVTGIVQSLPIIIPAAIQLVTTLITEILGLIPILIDAGLRLIEGLVTGLLQAIPSVATALITSIPKILSAFINAVPQLLLAGIEIVTAIVRGIGNALPQVIDTLRTQVIPTLLNTLREEGPKLIQQGFEAIQQFMQGWVDNASVIMEVIQNDIIPAITEFFQESPEFVEAGVEIMRTLMQAFADNVALFTDFVTNEFVPAVTALLEENPEVIQAGVDMIVAIVEGMLESTELVTTFVVDTLIPEMTDVIIENGPALTDAAIQIMKAFASGLLRSIPSIVAASSRIGNSLLSRLLGFGFAMANAGATVLGRFVYGFINAVGSQIGRSVRAVRDALIGGFAGAGSWLVNAGRRIIDGLIGGIQAGFARVRSVLSTLTGMLPDWKGPAEVDRRILRESGQMVMQGFQLGLEDERQAIQRTLRGLTADLPAFTAGPVRGGDGASMAGTGTGGGTVITIEPGAIVIQGGGREAGIEAAEAVLERLGQAATVR